jgi:hypothetical protein
MYRFTIGLILVASAYGDVIISSFANGSGAGPSAGSNQWISQQFTLSSAITISSIDLSIESTLPGRQAPGQTNYAATGAYVVIYSDSGNAVGGVVMDNGAVLGSITATGTVSNTAFSDVNFLFDTSHSTVAAGTYWLLYYPQVLNNDSAWERATSPGSTGPGGTITTLFTSYLAGDSSYTYQSNGPLLMTINGTAATAAVPEPGTISLFLAGFTVVALRKRQIVG